MTDTELQQLYARIATRPAPPGRAACVAPDVLLALVEGRAAETEAMQALRHVAACGSCRADLDLLRSAADAGRGLRRRYVPALSVAASLVVLAGAAAVWRSVVWRPEPLRGGDQGVPLLRPSGDVAAAGPLVLMWRALPHATRYEVEVVDARGRVLFSASTRDTTAPVPNRAGVVPGTDYYWWVQALLDDGTEPQSRAQHFRVRQR